MKLRKKNLVLSIAFIAMACNVNYNASDIESADNYISIRTYSKQVEEEIQGVEFSLYDADGNFIEKQYSDSEGVILFDDLSVGNYYIKQGVTPVNYINYGNSWNVQISDDNNQKTINNPLINSHKAVITIRNYSSNGEDVSGFTYNIYDEDGHFIEQITTDSSGLATSDALDYGTYYVKQVGVPDGYICDSKVYKMEVSKQYSNVSLTKENKKVTSNERANVANQDEDVLSDVSSVQTTGLSTTGKSLISNVLMLTLTLSTIVVVKVKGRKL